MTTIDVNLFNGTIPVYVMKSANVRAYPCGRRRAIQQFTDNQKSTYLPFDPESRLNTEANIRKHSSLNGFTQTYLNEITDNVLNITLAGYNFIISTADENLISGVTTQAGTDVEAIYANILVQDAFLFQDKIGKHLTDVLSTQYITEGTANIELDLLIEDESVKSDEYFFTGLSFSTESLAQAVSNTNTNNDTGLLTTTDSFDTYTFSKTTYYSQETPLQHTIVSLKILEKSGDSWIPYQPAYLPKIVHGSTEDSVTLYGDLDIIKSGKTVFKVDTTAECPNAKVDGDLEVTGDLKVTAAAEFGSTLTTTGDLTTAGNLKTNKSLTVGNGVVIDEGDITASNSTLTAKTISASGDITAACSITTKAINSYTTDPIQTRTIQTDPLVVKESITLYKPTDDTSKLEYKIPALDVIETGGTDKVYQLQFTYTLPYPVE